MARGQRGEGGDGERRLRKGPFRLDHAAAPPGEAELGWKERWAWGGVSPLHIPPFLSSSRAFERGQPQAKWAHCPQGSLTSGGTNFFPKRGSCSLNVGVLLRFQKLGSIPFMGIREPVGTCVLMLSLKDVTTV